MTEPPRPATPSSGGQAALTLAAVVIVIAGIKAAAAILIPFLLAVFVAIVLAPGQRWLVTRGMPQPLALVLLILALLLSGLLLAALLGSSLEQFSRSLPHYQERLHEGATWLLGWLADHGAVVSRELVFDTLDPGKAMQLVARLLGGLGSVLTNGFLILVTVIFLLAEASVLPSKWRLAFSAAESSLAHAGEVAASINRYMAIKALFSLLTGLVVGLWLYALGVDFPLLWGVLAFALNFVPNIGSILAAVPAVLLALVQFGWFTALLVVMGYLITNVVIGTILEPRYMGRGLGLSTLVVFLSLVFWGWLLGPVGMLLSVPLTITAKIALAAGERTRWIAVLLGPAPPHGSMPR